MGEYMRDLVNVALAGEEEVEEEEAEEAEEEEEEEEVPPADSAKRVATTANKFVCDRVEFRRLSG